ncbi:SusC/RagA family TonB-linked outer membrane protein [Algoriphagus sp. D3-2-R+10]|uniref:SusC/RagA family TonB-linked outer membrane protein n=1 Tax=Algoriphagus aurantiacus TaxID=3103948 RepID=UPI002B3F4B80|nr:SusC/RagA family TonB-linked outer membrane protein [Algoriphagus sp. D3-2-R+10]MEB2777413.1 SusC/RagA family TonB-linked outer membrane protein [Algoriphagus sp. D3-2-R+10]
MKIYLRSLLMYASKTVVYLVFVHFLFFNMVAADSIFGQTIYDTKLSIEIKDQPLSWVFDEIEKKAPFRFVFGKEVSSLNKRYFLKYNDTTLAEILKDLEKKSSLNFKVINGMIAVKVKEAERPKVQKQVKVITGIVSEKGGSGLPGVNILVKGTTYGTITDLDGNFSLEVPDDSSILVVSYVGYTAVEVDISSKIYLEIFLEPSFSSLSEVVITALGTKQIKDQSGASSSSVSSESIQRSGETGLINGLAGKASGVRIGKMNGDPGAGSVIQIRGVNTIEGASQPLIILDGVPISNENSGSGTISQQSRLNDINQNDIESVQVLKGASAAALWGSRAANGVIVITTKNGKANQKPSVNYSFSQSFDKINVWHPLQDSYGQGRNGVWNISAAESWGDKISDRSGLPDELNTLGAYFISDISGVTYYPVIGKNSRETYLDENYDQVFQTGSFGQHDVSVNGGGQKASYFFSYGNLSQDGITRNFTYNKQNIRLNTQVQLTDWITWNNKVSYNFTKSNRIHQAGDDTNGLLLGLLRSAPDFDNSDYIGTYVNTEGEVFPGRHRNYRRHLGETQNPIYNNPGWTINEQSSLSEVNRFIIAPEIQLDPAEWVNVILRGGIDYYTDNRESFFPIGSAGSRNTGAWDQQLRSWKEVNFDAIVSFNREITEDISGTLTLGANYNDRYSTFNSTSISPFAVASKLPTTDLNPDQSASSWSRSITHLRSNRGYGVLNLGFYDQLFLNASGALEAASTVGGTFFYPSVDLAWQFTKAVEIPGLSFGKLRASFGQVGIQPNPYKFYTLATTGFDTFGGSFQIDSERGNLNLKPEVKTEWEIGADLRFLNDKLVFGATYYQNRINDILFAVKTNPSTGFTTEYTNAGIIENKGLELDLSATVVQRESLSIAINGNFSNNRNLVVELRGAETVDIGGTSKAVQGHPMSAFWLPGTVRNEDGSFALDANGFPKVDTQRRVIGNPNPEWRGGLGAQLNWKNLDFGFLFEHSQGGDYINRTRVVMYGFGTHQDVSNEITLTEDLTNISGTLVPAGTTVRGNIADFGAGNVLLDEAWYTGIGGGLGFNKVNDLFIEDATWTKLRNVTLGYTLQDSPFLDKIKLQSLRVSFSGRDLFLWTDLIGVDPETNNYGVSNAFGMNYFNNPGTKSFLFNIQARF